MPTGTANNYYLTREREALARARAAADPAVRNIHLELAKRYADRMHAEEIRLLAAAI